jgi:hypothetical protein
MPSIDFGMVLTIALGVALGLIVFNALVVVFTFCSELAHEVAGSVLAWSVVIAIFIGVGLLVNHFSPDTMATPSTSAGPGGASGSTGGDWFAQHAPNAGASGSSGDHWFDQFPVVAPKPR